jgi:hypothetical protein
VAAFSHGGEADPPELSVHPIAEGVVPGGVAGVASEARRLGVSSSAVYETELPPAIAICTKGTNGLANQRLECRREEVKVRWANWISPQTWVSIRLALRHTLACCLTDPRRGNSARARSALALTQMFPVGRISSASPQLERGGKGQGARAAPGGPGPTQPCPPGGPRAAPGGSKGRAGQRQTAKASEDKS